MTSHLDRWQARLHSHYVGEVRRKVKVTGRSLQSHEQKYLLLKVTGATIQLSSYTYSTHDSEEKDDNFKKHMKKKTWYRAAKRYAPTPPVAVGHGHTVRPSIEWDRQTDGQIFNRRSLDRRTKASRPDEMPDILQRTVR